MSKEITQFVTDLLDAWNAHDMERVAGFYTPDYEGMDVAQATPQCGWNGIRQMVACYTQAFPDLHFTADETVIEGNRVAVVWTAHGTHQGPLLNIPPSGRRIVVQGVSVLTLAGARVQRAVHVWDVAGLLRSIGLLPEL